MEKRHFQLASMIVTAFASVGLAATASAKSSANSCLDTITTCGCTITKAGNYQVTAALDMTGITTPDCIDIKAPKVNLRTDGYSINGNGNGVGINVLKSAANANLQLADPAKPDDNLSAISNFENGIVVQGTGAILNGFDVSNNNGDGLLIKGSKCAVMNFTSNNSSTGNGVTVSGSSGCQVSDFTASGNAGAGVALIKAKKTTLQYFNADDSGDDGVTLTSSSSNAIINPEAAGNGGNGLTLSKSSKNVLTAVETTNNGGSGIAFSGSSSNSLFDFTALDNGIYGVWLQASKSNSVRFGLALGNAQAGIYLGCDATNGPVSAACSPAVKPSTKNIVTAIEAGNDPDASLPQAYGVAIDLGDQQNKISGISALPIPSVPTDGNGTYDLFDANANCAKNEWFANAGTLVFPPGSPSCTEPAP